MSVVAAFLLGGGTVIALELIAVATVFYLTRGEPAYVYDDLPEESSD